ncbi:unnamed protein product [Moneuplotes crassus]|uniref:Uncharacterized protein n=1 Tax=Euplotes crassus TaxID=5936 RepID=A0AAD1U310_EUPCR|nr:unnamed protein product [Moneuplotes crassus]
MSIKKFFDHRYNETYARISNKKQSLRDDESAEKIKLKKVKQGPTPQEINDEKNIDQKNLKKSATMDLSKVKGAKNVKNFTKEQSLDKLNSYTFYDPKTEYKLKFINEEFIRNSQLHTETIRKMVVQKIYSVVMKNLDKRFEVTDFNKENLELWGKMFLRIKPIRKIEKELTDKVQMVLMKELIHNKEQLTNFVEMPRVEKKMSVVPPREKQKLPFDDLGLKLSNTSSKESDVKLPKPEKVDPAALHFENMKSGMEYIDRMIDKMEHDSETIKLHIDHAKKERRELGGMESYPLERLQNMLHEWDNQDMCTKDEIMDYAHELWVTVGQFEKELKKSTKGHELELEKVKYTLRSRIEWIKYKSHLHISALEEALRMTKEKKNTEIENMKMALSEYESRLLNQQINEPELSEILNFDPNKINDLDQLKRLAFKLQNAGKSLKNEAMQIKQKFSGQEHKINTLKESLDNLTEKYSDMTEVKDLYEKVISHIMAPPMKVVDIIAFGKFKKVANKSDPKELLEFFQKSQIKDNLLGISEQFISMVDSLNDLKKAFEDLKVVPKKKIIVDPTSLSVRKIEITDRTQNIFCESFITNSHCKLLNKGEAEEVDNVPKDKKRRGKRGKKGRGDGSFVRNEIEEKKQEIKEISNDITDNMKYLVESKYSLQLKKLRKQRAATLEEDQQEDLIKNLKIKMDGPKNSKKKVTVDDVLEKINEKVTKKVKKKSKKVQKKVSAQELIKAQENIFMGEDMNAKIPFQDCIEVQFGEEGNIECFKLRKNLTRLAIEKNQENAIEMIKNFEYSIDQLNQALSIKKKKEFKASTTQTSTQKPVLLGFMKQLLSEFESYDGGEKEKKEIEKELQSYGEEDLLATECTRITDSEDHLMTFKELLFTLFEYAKQKAISIAYRKNYEHEEIESPQESRNEETEHIKFSERTGKNTKRVMYTDPSGSLHSEDPDLPARYQEEVKGKEKKKAKIVAQIPMMKLYSESPKTSSKRETTINIFTLLDKHEGINETGLIRNVENKRKYALPLMNQSNKNPRASNQNSRQYVDQGISIKSSQRNVPIISSNMHNVGCQADQETRDAFTSTVDVDQSEQLANMIKVEAKKTIQLLELFMKINAKEKNEDYKQELNEIQRKTDEELNDAYDKFYTYAEETLESESSVIKNNDNAHDEDLFKGMEDDYAGTQTTFVTANGFKDRRAPFSKYVENAMRRNQLNLSAEIQPINFSQERVSTRKNLNNSAENEDLEIIKKPNRSLNRTKLSIKPNFFQSTNPGKFFRVKLKPLQGIKDQKNKGYIKDLAQKSNEKDQFPSKVKKNIPGRNPEHFYEYQFGFGQGDSKDSTQLASLSYEKNRDIPENIRNQGKTEEVSKMNSLTRNTIGPAKAETTKVSYTFYPLNSIETT